jgi:hypothetical protein
MTWLVRRAPFVQRPDPGAGELDNNDVLTDSNEESKLFST